MLVGFTFIKKAQKRIKNEACFNITIPIARPALQCLPSDAAVEIRSERFPDIQFMQNNTFTTQLMPMQTGEKSFVCIDYNVGISGQALYRQRLPIPKMLQKFQIPRAIL